jgi:hypothetical protein
MFSIVICVTSIDGTTRSAVGVAESIMETSLVTLASSMWKLNKPKATSKPPIFARVDPVEHEMGSTIVAVGVLTTTIGAESIVVGEAASMMVGEAVSTIVGEAVSMMVGEAASMMVDEAVSTMVSEAASMMLGEAASTSMGDAELMTVADDEPMTLGNADESMETVDAGESMMVGDGAGESVDPDPVIPIDGAN